MDPRTGPEGAAAEAALERWRRKAANIVIAAVAVVHLPEVVLSGLGYGPVIAMPLKAAGISAYLVIVAAAFLGQIEHRTRVRVFFLAAFVAIGVVNLGIPQGPYAQVGLVTLPILASVLAGVRAGRLTMLGCLMVLLIAPVLRVQPQVALMLGIDHEVVEIPWSVVWAQAAAQASFLIGLLLLLDIFHRFLTETLSEQCRATAELEKKAADLAAAQQKAEHAMRERRRLEREIAGVGDEERRHLGQELHDGVCQQLTAAMLRSQALERRVERGVEVTQEDFRALSELLGEAIDETRNVAHGLCPLDPDPEALEPALRALSKRIREAASVRCEFSSEGDLRVPDPGTAQHLYRIAQEALSNAVRHGNPRRIAVELKAGEQEMTLRVQDDGRGIPADPPIGGMGLRTMAYRAQLVDGELSVGPAAGGGTCVTCRVPLVAGDADSRYNSGETR